MHPARCLTTDRLTLNAPVPHDTQAVEALLTDAHVRRYLGGPVVPGDIPARVHAYLTPPAHVGIWALRLRDHTGAIGLITLAPHHNGKDQEVSYQLHPRFWQKGYAREAVHRVLTHAHDDLALPRVLAETQSANTASCRLLERLGLNLLEQRERFGAAQSVYVTPFNPG